MRSFTGDQLLVATHNSGKLEEITALVAPYGVKVIGAAELGLSEPAETETSFVGNARIKAQAAVQATGLPALSDDSGIVIDALGGAPGVYTADWAQTDTGRDFGIAMQRAHDELVSSGCAQPWTARFCCTLVLAWPDGQEQVFEGTAEGWIIWPMRGVQGHGYDPVFQPLGHDLTFAEMTSYDKNQISHRADAFRKLIAGCFA
ncbi:RdgB/HAM1 family non-canonical purine NTP pyrophosphatase [uncultured Roseovarius sp.]|uniref:RdgB/HAM1 family non-canonical purine NTP pyrophosphatase n=1 Tax=uncultured Roseovarius sp. TaxID=293344 RepID=UPI00260B52F0|nr:RdgB/HAM1 family non-canonical purine NTP pyrophosphatase [uncultured Roseovarius sp.]